MTGIITLDRLEPPPEDNLANPSENTGQTSSDPAPIRRRPGRPRKEPESIPPSSPNRKRGRPRKTDTGKLRRLEEVSADESSSDEGNDAYVNRNNKPSKNPSKARRSSRSRTSKMDLSHVLKESGTDDSDSHDSEFDSKADSKLPSVGDKISESSVPDSLPPDTGDEDSKMKTVASRPRSNSTSSTGTAKKKGVVTYPYKGKKMLAALKKKNKYTPGESELYQKLLKQSQKSASSLPFIPSLQSNMSLDKEKITSILKGVSQQPASATKKVQKRPKIRTQISSLNSPSLEMPAQCATSWNASEIIKDFLFIGAGWCQSNRCLVNREGDDFTLKTNRVLWTRSRNMVYALNMAGSPLQKELRGIKYVLDETRSKRIDMNDLDIWDEENMHKGFDKGAEFIEEAWKTHREVRSKNAMTSNVAQRRVPPTILVHCVAGVNRSPMCVVWWLVRFHGVSVRDAWDLIRTRRDIGANWKNVTLGGEAPPEGYVPSEEDIENAMNRKFQHLYDLVGIKEEESVPIDQPSILQLTVDQSIKESLPVTVRPPPILQRTHSFKDDLAKTSAIQASLPPISEQDSNEMSVMSESNTSQVFDAGDEKAQPQVRFPKALWFFNAERILGKFVKRTPASNPASPIFGPAQAESLIPPNSIVNI